MGAPQRGHGLPISIHTEILKSPIPADPGNIRGAYTMAMYFTSEQDAREGERKEPPPHLKAQMDEMNKLNIGVPEFLDLREPWLYSPR